MPRHRVQNGGSLRAFSLPFTFLECHASDDVAPVPAVARCGVTEVAAGAVAPMLRTAARPLKDLAFT
jgi:hypothetical protein